LKSTMMKGLTTFDPEWEQLFVFERGLFADALGDKIQDIHHIGSTAVPGFSCTLRVNAEVCQAYALLKTKLTACFENERFFHAEGKGNFIVHTMADWR
jgi:GrpB-like predicted nucleotidyltransferase (UPF0157 family)